jgi:hypothetical protein
MEHAQLIVPVIISFGVMIMMFESFAFFESSNMQRAVVATPTQPLQNACLDSDFDGAANANSFASADPERVQEVLSRTRAAIERYQNVETAVADGYKLPLAAEKQKIVHFTNYWYGFKAAFGFDPEHPTSLVYEKTEGSGYRLIGVVFSAPARFSEEQLEQRIPTRLAQWRPHPLLGWIAELRVTDAYGRNVQAA